MFIGESPVKQIQLRVWLGAVGCRTLNDMAMGKRPAARQGSPWWVTTADSATNTGHPFFERLNRVLEEAGFDAFVEGLCALFYPTRMGRPSLRPRRYFRMVFSGYLEGLSSERGVSAAGLVRGRRSASMRRRWKRTRRCGASSGGTRENRTRRSFGGWRKRPGWRRRRGRTWLGSTGLGRTGRRRTRSGSLRRIRTRRSRR